MLDFERSRLRARLAIRRAMRSGFSADPVTWSLLRAEMRRKHWPPEFR